VLPEDPEIILNGAAVEIYATDAARVVELTDIDLVLADIAFSGSRPQPSLPDSNPNISGMNSTINNALARPPPVVTPEDAQRTRTAVVSRGMPSLGRLTPSLLTPSGISPSMFTPSQLMSMIAQSPMVTPGSGFNGELSSILAGLTPSTLAHLGIASTPLGQTLSLPSEAPTQTDTQP